MSRPPRRLTTSSRRRFCMTAALALAAGWLPRVRANEPAASRLARARRLASTLCAELDEAEMNAARRRAAQSAPWSHEGRAPRADERSSLVTAMREDFGKGRCVVARGVRMSLVEAGVILNLAGSALHRVEKRP